MGFAHATPGSWEVFRLNTDVKCEVGVFAGLSIRRKGIALLAVAVAAPLAASYTAFLANDALRLRAATLRDAESLAASVAAQSTHALDTRGRREAEAILGGLARHPLVVDACLYDASGKLLAAATREPSRRRRAAAQGRDIRTRWGEQIEVTQEVRVDGRTLGSVWLLARTDEAAAQFRRSLGVAAGVSAGALAMAVLLGVLLQRTLFAPIRRLAQALWLTGPERDKALGGHKPGRDEVGVLYNGLNAMLTQVQNREQELNEHRVNLERTVESRTQELKARTQEAKAASAAKGRFLAAMSHEIRTPMGGVMGMLDLLLDTQLDAQQNHFARTARESAGAMLTLLNDILDFSKAEAGKLEIELTDLDLRLTAQRAVDLLAGKAHAKGLELACHVDGNVPALVRGDPTRLGQVLLNLLGNAVKFTETGEVAVDVTLDEESASQAIVRFAVSDTGIGIPPEARDRLFKSFSQVDASTTRKYGGTGLGLAISKQLTKLMGGEIGAESEVGKGSTFWFTCRFEKQTGDAAAPSPDTAAHIGGPETPVEGSRHAGAEARRRDARILLAEDNEVNREIAESVLLKAGFRCDCAATGLQAVQALADGDYDLVLMDCMMPEMDGFEATRAIRAAEASAAASDAPGRRLPIIALTASAIDGERRRCLTAGMDDFLTKPLEPGLLIDTIDRWLSRTASGPPQSPAQEAPTQEALGPMEPAEDGAAPVSTPESDEPIDLPALLERCSGDPEFTVRMVERFLDRASADLRKIEETLTAGDAANLTVLAHGFKGAAATLSAEPLRERAARLEALGRAGDLAEAPTCLGELRCELERFAEFAPTALGNGQDGQNDDAGVQTEVPR